MESQNFKTAHVTIPQIKMHICTPNVIEKSNDLQHRFQNNGRPPSWIFEICYFTEKQFSIWRPSVILDLLWRHFIASRNCISCP